MSMFEIITTTETRYTVAALNTAVTKIAALGKKSNSNQLAIAVILYETSLLWDEESPDDFATVFEWAENALGYKKSQCYDLIRIGKRFVTTVGKGAGKTYHTNLLPPDYADFTISQLIQMLPYDDEIIREYCESGELNPQMSCKAIKAVLKATETESPDEDEETEETESTESETESPDEDEEITLTAESGESITIPRKVFNRMMKKYANNQPR